MSGLRQFARKVLETSGLEVRRLPSGWLARSEPTWRPELGAWTRGYESTKHRFIAEALADASLMTRFRTTTDLPERHGVGLDERCVEYPWALSRLSTEAKQILDAGSALNNQVIVDSAPLAGKNLHVLTLAPEASCFWSRGISYIYASLLDAPLRDDLYEAIVCISTLEHVGFDNFVFTGQHEPARPDEYLVAMKEMARLLKPGGSLFLTVPYGAQQNFGSFRQLDARLLDRAIDAFGPTQSVQQSFYRYTAGGWRLSNSAECADCRYVGWIAEVWLGKAWPEPTPVEPDFAAASRAVACVQLVKA